MKVKSKCLSHLRLDQTYCLLDARGVAVVLELFKAIDIRGEMALDGMSLLKSPHLLPLHLALVFVQTFSSWCS